MSIGKRPTDAEPADDATRPMADAPAQPGDASDPVAGPEPVVEGEAVELPADPPPPEPFARPMPAGATREPPPEPFARPIPAMPHVPPTTPLSAVSGAGAPIADGHGPDPLDGHGADSLMDPLRELAAGHPEYVVGAAFAGGILAAMILRRLGN